MDASWFWKCFPQRNQHHAHTKNGGVPVYFQLCFFADSRKASPSHPAKSFPEVAASRRNWSGALGYCLSHFKSDYMKTTSLKGKDPTSWYQLPKVASPLKVAFFRQSFSTEYLNCQNSFWQVLRVLCFADQVFPRLFPSQTSQPASARMKPRLLLGRLAIQ